MPKVKCSGAVRLRKFILEFGEDVILTDDLVLLCKVCGVKIEREKKSPLQRQIASEKHSRALQRRRVKTKRQHEYLSMTKNNNFLLTLGVYFLINNAILNVTFDLLWTYFDINRACIFLVIVNILTLVVI